MGEWDTAMERYLTALGISERIGSENMIGRCRNAIGSIYLMKGDLQGAERSISDALEMLVSDVDRSKALSNLAVVKWQLSELEKAIELIDESLGISRSLGDDIGISRALNNRGIILMQKGDLGGSLSTFEEALQICRHNRYRQTESIIEDNIGEVLVRKGEKEKALPHFRSSLGIARNLGFRWQIAEAMKNIALLMESREDKVSMLLEARKIFLELGAEREAEEITRLLGTGTANK